MKNTDLFQDHKPPRKKPRVLMRVLDVYRIGNIERLGEPCWCVFKCNKCGAITESIYCKNITEANRGIPCESCNNGDKLC